MLLFSSIHRLHCLFVIINYNILLNILQYSEQVVAALKLAVDGCADSILVFFLLLIIFLLSEQCAKIQKT